MPETRLQELKRYVRFDAADAALLLALPLGLWIGHKHSGLLLALSISSVGRSLPSVAIIGGSINSIRLVK